MAKPSIPDLSTMIAAGMDPKTGLPLKMGSDPTYLKNDINRALSVLDRQDAVNRYTWYNLPEGLDGGLMERLLYYKGQCALFYNEIDERFYFLPFTLDGGIDVYGRYTRIKPLAVGTDEKDGAREFLSGMRLKPIYDLVMPDSLTKDIFTGSCVILNDYTNGLSQTVEPRAILNKSFVEIESEILPMVRTALMNSTGVTGVRVNSEDEGANVFEASRAATNATLTGNRYVPIVGALEFQELGNATAANAADTFLLSLQSIDNMRRGALGLTNGGIFEKKARILQAEQAVNGVAASLTLTDGLALRQRFCDVVNSIWYLGIWCEASESAAQVDREGDMVADTDEKQPMAAANGGES